MSETTTLMSQQDVDKEFDGIIEHNFGEIEKQVKTRLSLHEDYVDRGPRLGRRKKVAQTAVKEVVAPVVTPESRPVEPDVAPPSPLEQPAELLDEVKTDETEKVTKNEGRFARIRRKLGEKALDARFFAMQNGYNPVMMGMSLANKGMNRMMERRDKLAEADGKLLSKKKVGLALGALGVMGAVGGFAAYKLGHDHTSYMDTLTSMAPSRPHVVESAGIDPATYQWNLDPANTTNVIAGGRGDGLGHGLNSIIGRSTSPDFAAARTDLIEYSAQIAPMPGDVETMSQSIAPGARQVVEAIQNSGNGQVHLIGHSEGTQVILRGVSEYMDAHNGILPPNVKITIIDSPNTPGSGVFHDEAIKQFKPLFDAAGIDMRSADLPDGAKGVTFIGGQNDFVANAGPGRNIFRKVGNLADFALGGDGHAVQGFDDPARHVVHEIDGNTYITVKPVGTQNPFLRLLEQHGLAPEHPKVVDDAFEAWMPAGEVGKAAPAVNVNDAVDKSADAIRRVMDDNHIAYDPAHFDIVKNLPIPQEVQDSVNRVLQPEAWVNNNQAQEVVTNYTPAAPTPAPVQEYVQPVQEYVAPVQNYVPPVEQQVNAILEPVLQQAPVEQVQQFNTAVDQAFNQASTAAAATGNQQIQQGVQDLQNQANNVLAGIGVR